MQSPFYHPNPFYRMANTLWLKQINPDNMQVDEALYHISIIVYIAEEETKTYKRLSCK